ncbi:hypothetical protein ANN_20324 [Periplaneta americana]|uniref:Uncharacterized protein n=1 Tax=Periplaneta americana TaxID=6978 RepID=A0ABQ8SDL1_PERAM|nr:hypothetical protein ANN_20324 [Periplaneta americana]
MVPFIRLCDDRIISRNLWPPRSPDLTTPDNICYRDGDESQYVNFQSDIFLCDQGKPHSDWPATGLNLGPPEYEARALPLTQFIQLKMFLCAISYHFAPEVIPAMRACGFPLFNPAHIYNALQIHIAAKRVNKPRREIREELRRPPSVHKRQKRPVLPNIPGTADMVDRYQDSSNCIQHISEILLSKNLKVRIYRTVILSVVLYGCETWTLTLREEHRLRVFENKVLRKIFGAKRDEVTGEWRKLHNTELHALYSSPDIIRNIKCRRLRWAGLVTRMGESRNAYRVLVGRPERKRPLGRPRRRWEDNIKMDLRKVGYDDRDWINLAQDRDRWRAYVRAAVNLEFPKSHLQKSNRKSKELAYKTLVRPIMEYGTVGWDPYRQNQMDSIEKVQRKAEKYVKMGKGRGEEIVKDLGWESLKSRRQKPDSPHCLRHKWDTKHGPISMLD